MAIYLPKHDSLFIHIPKCGGHFVEKVLTHFGIEWEIAETITNVCPRHGKRSDVINAKFAFCTVRTPESWMHSYWFFALQRGPVVFERAKQYAEGITYHHRRLGPPFNKKTWEEWSGSMKDECREYLFEMVEGCDLIINSTTTDSMAAGLSLLLTGWGYDISKEEILSIDKANETIIKGE
mgnify:CR=1 FL=1